MTANQTDMTASDLYRRLLTYVKPYWVVFVGAILAMAVFAATETALAALLKELLDGGFVEQDPDIIKLLPLGLIGIFLVRGVASFITGYGLGWIARNVIKNLRQEMFSKLISLPASFYDGTTSGELMSKLLYDVEQVANAATDAIITIIRDSLTIVGLLIWMVYLSGFLSLIILTTVPAIGYVVYKISHRFRAISKNIQDSMGEVGHISSEAIEGHREVKVFGSQTYESLRFDKVNQKNRRQRMKKITTEAISQPAIQLIAVLGFSGVIYLATLPEMLAEITVGGFTSFFAAMFMILTPLKRLTKVNSKLQAGIAASQSVFNLLDQQPEQDNGTQRLEHVKGEIEYQQVHFQYQQSDKARN